MLTEITNKKFENVPIIALSASAPSETRDKIISILKLKSNEKTNIGRMVGTRIYKT
jgi:superfamily II DNA helicase RecQ